MTKIILAKTYINLLWNKKTANTNWEDFWDNFPFWEFIIGLLALGSIVSIINASKPDELKFPAVVVEVIENVGFDDCKIKFIDDGTIDMRNLDGGIGIGDTVLLKK